MNVKVNTIGGGTFSKFMLAVQSILKHVNDVDSINNIYIDIDKGRICRVRHRDISKNPFDYVLEQNPNLTFDKTIAAVVLPVYENLLESNDLNKLRTICSKIKIKKEILDMINPNINETTLGVHVRLTDMDQLHPNYGRSNTQRYVDKINSVIKGGDRSIFVASDNSNSLNILKDKFNIMFNETSNRSKDEQGVGYMQYLINRSADEQLWVDSFLEMLSLARCGELIYKVSNLNNASVIFSETIKEVHRL